MTELAVEQKVYLKELASSRELTGAYNLTQKEMNKLAKINDSDVLYKTVDYYLQELFMKKIGGCCG